MADLPPSSSQGSHYERHRILPDQENIPSSPPVASSPLTRRSSNKPKALPTVTPKRFRKFFTPRDAPRHGLRSSTAGRQLRDITKNGANRRATIRPVKDELLHHLENDRRPAKRRKHSFDMSSSPPRISPLKHVQIASAEDVGMDLPSSPAVEDGDDLPSLLEETVFFPQPIRRLQIRGASRRILERSFGGFEATSRNWRGSDHGAEWLAETANFVTTPTDVHTFQGSALPFCTTSCNTNSLVAIGDEGGTVRLIDTNTDFATAHLSFRPHHNAVMDMAFSSDDFMLATASGDQTARVVDMHTQQITCILTGHESSVKQVRFQPNDENVITTSSRDGTVQVWDLRCAERGSMQSLRLGQRIGLNEDGVAEPSVRYCKNNIKVGPAHRSSKGSNIPSPSTLNSADAAVSITAIEHLPHGREHLLLTSSELSASIKLWDLRTASRRNGDAVPVSSTPIPESHRKSRNFGISSMSLSGDGARLYTLCKDATIYVYSTNHLMFGTLPDASTSMSRRRPVKESKVGAGPLNGFRHPALRTGSFYLKSALRKARGDKSELLAVGNTEAAAIVFPTDEQHLRRPQTHPEDDDDDGSDTIPELPIHEQGTPLIRGHRKEITSLSWSHDGALVTISDDFTARCWREDAEKAREMRVCGEGKGMRWGHGWAEVDGAWDREEG